MLGSGYQKVTRCCWHAHLEHYQQRPCRGEASGRNPHRKRSGPACRRDQRRGEMDPDQLARSEHEHPGSRSGSTNCPASIVAQIPSPYFCGIAAPGDSCAAHAHAEPPSVASPVPSGLRRWVAAHSAGSGRSPGRWTPSGSGSRRTR